MDAKKAARQIEIYRKYQAGQSIRSLAKEYKNEWITIKRWIEKVKVWDSKLEGKK
jgi:Mor family transcriptional regulator